MRTTRTAADFNADFFNAFGRGHLPALIGVEIVTLADDAVHSRLALRPELMAPNGFLHAATVIALADTSCGYGCVKRLPEGAQGFTTVELKASFLGTAREGAIECRATPLHLGRTTQVWDAEVTAPGPGAAPGRIALFRCTQMILWPK